MLVEGPMRLVDRMSAFLQALPAESADGARARRRVAALAAMAAFLLMLLVLVGLGQIALLLVALAALGVAVVAAAVLIRSYGARGAGDVAAATKRATLQIVRVGSGAAVAARDNVKSRIAATPNVWPTRTRVDRRREALRANVAGAQLRRDGAYGDAAERHRVALALFRELGDRRSEAMTLNDLALALDRAGDPAAIDLFEESATILGELGEQQQEGKVIANLALAFRRRGREEQSAEVLEIALGKLNPESQAYRQVEGLRRAS
jgi:tetratricopeptide (TPR) repeat protein